jgi:Kdo2-lipid IVA lauroyltransferase/acyltransferase
LLSLLPLRVLYLLSDAIYFLVYYVFGYRKEVVFKNLAIAFPEKSDTEKTKIAKEFYGLFIDNFIETIKLISISKKQFLKRLDYDDSLLKELLKTNQPIQLHSGHFFNYEFMNYTFSIYKQHYTWLGIYSQLSNQAFNKIIYNMRSRFGTTLISTKEFRTAFHQYTKEPYILGLAADQSTSNPLNAYWVDFFGKKTAFVKGPEKGARAMNTAVVMVYIYPVKRGYYKIETSLLTTEPNIMPNGSITKALSNFLEQKIKEHPANYLWSHKRWKHEYDAAKHQELYIA